MVKLSAPSAGTAPAREVWSFHVDFSCVLPTEGKKQNMEKNT